MGGLDNGFRVSSVLRYLLYLTCCILFVYLLGWFISFKSFWVFDMMETTDGRLGLVICLTLVIFLSYITNFITGN